MEGDQKQNQPALKRSHLAEISQKQLYLVCGIAAGLLAAALLVWGIILISDKPSSNPQVVSDNDVTETEITSLNTEATDLGEAAKVAYAEGDGNLDAAEAVFDQAIQEAQATAKSNDNAETRYYANQLTMQKMGFYVNSDLYYDAIELGESLNPETMVPEQRSSYYMIMATCYAYAGNEEKGLEYQNKAYEASIGLGRGAGGE